MANPWETDPVVQPRQSSGNPWDSDPIVDMGQFDQRNEIVNQYANEIIRRNYIYRTIPQKQLEDPNKLRRLAEMEAERNGFKPLSPIKKQDRTASFATGYGQGGTFGFADEISGAADFVGGAAMGLARGEGLGAIDSGKEAYSKRVEEDRRIQRQAEFDNPMTNLAGNLTGGIVTYAPAPAGWMGAGARTTPQVAAQLAQKADRLSDLSKTGSSLLSANRASRAANLSARSAALARPAANMGEAAARFGSRVGESVLKGAGYGAAYGGLYGMGSAEGGIPERLDETAEGAAFGAAGGAVLSPAAQFVLAPIAGKVGYSMFTSLDDKALDRVLERAARSGTSLQKVRADFDAWKKTGEVPETLAELMGPHERSLLSAMITVNRETEERAGEILLGRGKKEVDRLEKSFARAMGAGRGDFASAREGAKKARAQDPTPLYDSAHYDQNGTLRALDPQKQADLNNILIDEDDVLTILKDAKADLNRSGNKGARDEVMRYMEAVQDLRAGKQAQLPNLSVQAADYIERAINDAFKTAGAGTGKVSGGVRGWGMLRDAVRNIIDDTGVGAARATAAERIRRGELLDEGRKFLEPGVDIEDITDTLRGNPALGIDPASPAGQQAYTVGAARAIGDTLRNTQDMKGFADATRKVARTPAIREKVNAVLPRGRLTNKGVPDQRSRQTKLNQQLERDIERTADRADFTNNMLGNSRTAFRQGAVQDALADDQFSTAVGEGVRDLLLGGPGGLVQNAAGRFAKGVSARIGQPGVMRPGLNRKMADILLATDKDIPVQIARLAARAAQRANSRVGRPASVLTAAGQTKPPRGTPPSGGSPTPSPNALAPQGPIRAAGFLGFGGKKAPVERTQDTIGREIKAIEKKLRRKGYTLNEAETLAEEGNLPPELRGLMIQHGDLVRESGRMQGAARTAKGGVENDPEYLRAESEMNKAADDVANAEYEIARELRERGLNWEGDDAEFMGVVDQLRREGKLSNYIASRVEDLRAASTRMFDAEAKMKARVQAFAPKPQGAGALRGDLGNALAGAGLGAAGPADSTEERLRNIGIGFGVGLGARRVGKAFGAGADDVATAGVGGPRKPRAPNALAPKPSKLGTRAADATAVAALASSQPAQADTGGASAELEAANQRVRVASDRVLQIEKTAIPQLEADLRLLEDPNSDPRKIQTLLANRDFDLGPNGVDGRIGPDTRKAIASNVRAIKGEIAFQRQELEKARKEEADARDGLKQARYLQMQRESEPSGTQNLLVGGGMLTAAIAGAMLAKGGRFRGVNFGRYGSIVKNDASAAATARKVNKLINTGKITSAQSGPNSINQRAANANTIARIGGAGRRVPFEQESSGVLKERTRKDILGRTVRPVESTQLFKEKRFNSNDAYAFGVAGLDVGISEVGIRHLKSEIQKAEDEMARAKEADDDAAFYAALKSKQSNEGLLVFAQIAQKVGMGYIGGRAISGIKPYSAPPVKLADIEAERNLILKAINKPPPKPRKPASTKSNP